jgi:hypothetical protein
MYLAEPQAVYWTHLSHYLLFLEPPICTSSSKSSTLVHVTNSNKKSFMKFYPSQKYGQNPLQSQYKPLLQAGFI